MSLRNRTLLVIVAVTLVFAIVGAFHSYYSFLSDYKKLEITDIEASVVHTHASLEYELEELSIITNDWSAWDDTYEFVQDRNEDYLDANLVDGTFETLGLDLAIYFNTDGQIIYKKAYDLEEGEEIPVSNEILDYIENNLDLASIEEDDYISGFLPYNDNLMLFNLSPILTSLDEGPSRGTLFFARQANEKLIERLKLSQKSVLSILPYNDQNIPHDSTYYVFTNSDQIHYYVHEINNDLIEYYILLENINNQPIFMIKNVEERVINAQGSANVRNQVTFIVILCVVAGGLLAHLLDKYILTRISKLHKSVIAYRTKKDIRESVKLPGDDELSQLSTEIDNTLHSLLTAQSKLNGYLQYGNLMVDISTRFINLPVNKIDKSLQKVLETICKYIDVDRGQIIIFKEDENSFENVYEWQKNGAGPINKEFLKIDKNVLHWAFKNLNNGNSIIVSRIDDLPKTALIEKTILKKHKIQSVIGVPLMVTGKLIGILAIQMISGPRTWDEQTPILMEIISNIIANAVDRKRNEIELQNSKQFQYQLNQIAKTSIEKDTYISSIRALSHQLCSLISSDRGWLVLHDDKQNFRIFESGKETKPDEEMFKTINYLIDQTSDSYLIYDSKSVYRKKKAINPDILGPSFIAIPLSGKKQHMGLIILANDDDHCFTTLERNICMQAAKQITLAIIKIRALEDSQRLSSELQDLREAVVEFSSVLDINKLRNSILSRAVKLLKAEGGEFYNYLEDTNELATVSSLNMNGDYTGTKIKVGQGAAGRAVMKRKIFSLTDYSSWAKRIPEYDGAKIRATLSIPLTVGERILGCISVFHYTENKNFSKNDENMLSIFAQHASIAMDNAMLFNKIQEMAHVDELTGLLNRRALKEIGDYEIKRSIRLLRPIAVVMVDLDNYKRINDTYNHIVGDKALKEVARIFRENLRNIDILGRYGGDECIIIMPETNLENAVQTIKRVQEKLQQFIFEIENHKIQITASYGISVYSENPPSLETMIKEADAALYAAKEAGRNCIRVYTNK